MLDEHERTQRVAELILRSFTAGYLAHSRGVQNLAQEILKDFNGAGALWAKWSADRMQLLDLAKTCWIPVDGLQKALNALPGPPLTTTDVEQRMKVLLDDRFVDQPRADLREGCREIYRAEVQQGTELRAIISAIDDYLGEVCSLECREEHERQEREREAKRMEQEMKLLSGVDCGWTRLGSSDDWFRRDVGRLFRLRKVRDATWELSEMQVIDRLEDCRVIGTYKGRRQAREAIEDIVFREPSS